MHLLIAQTNTTVTSLAEQQKEIQTMLSQDRDHFDRTFSRFADVQRSVIKASTDQAFATGQLTASVEALRSQQCGATNFPVVSVTKVRDRLLNLSADIISLLAARESARPRDASRAYDQETINEYRKQFQNQAGELTRGLVANGIKDQRLNFLASSIANIRELAERLAAGADKLPH
jgi:hypothetical protein